MQVLNIYFFSDLTELKKNTHSLKIILVEAVILFVCRNTIFLVLLLDYIKTVAVGTFIWGALLVCSGRSAFLILLLQVYLSDWR